MRIMCIYFLIHPFEKIEIEIYVILQFIIKYLIYLFFRFARLNNWNNSILVY